MDTLVRASLHRNGPIVENGAHGIGAQPVARVRTSHDHHGMVVENVAQSMSNEVAQALSARRTKRLGMLAIAQENDFTDEMRREASELRWRTAQTMGGPGLGYEEFEGALRDAAVKEGETISQILRDRIARRMEMIHEGPKWSDSFVPPAPPPVDHSFWWAFTNSQVGSGTHANFSDDGLHFWGGPNLNKWNGELHTSLGATATFALQPARFPVSPGGMFRSSPSIELNGGILAYAPDYDLLQAHGIAECKLFLRQTIFQVGFGQNGPMNREIVESKGYVDWRLYLRDTGFSRHADLPGFKPMPEVMYNANQIAPAELFVELEFRLDMYLKSAGTKVWCDPEVVFRTFQWEPTPV
jgi:hypothetical protein